MIGKGFVVHGFRVGIWELMWNESARELGSFGKGSRKDETEDEESGYFSFRPCRSELVDFVCGFA